MDTAPTSQPRPSIGVQLLTVLNRLSVIPGGHYLFNRIIAWKIPYSASIGARVVALEPGYAKLILKDKKSIRNHVNSIHAVALTNFGELTSGLALNTGLPDNVRGIVTKIETDYMKKARGTLVAECRCDIPAITNDIDYIVEATIKDAENDPVAIVKVVWRLGLQ